MSENITCSICGRKIEKKYTYFCLKCGRNFCSDCMIDSTSFCPDC
ncbi:hypothetical protein KAI60_01270 [Candidatus Bathyarchaeota archaeon]|nr:hypothetical protein [Candidatus Bathyarchaeota archaeon]